jgi:hypothetical protein
MVGEKWPNNPSDPKSQIVNQRRNLVAFWDSLLACLEFAAFLCGRGSAEEGRDDKKYPNIERQRSVNVARLLLKRHHRLHASVAVVMGLLLLTLPIAQATTFGSAIRITTNTGYSEYPSVAVAGNYVYVVWGDNTPVTGSGSTYEVWLRVSSNSGASFGSPVRLTTNTGVSEYPSVAAVGSNVYVAWDDNTPVTGSDGSYEIWLRVSSNNGVSFGSPIRITTNTGTSGEASVAAVGNNVYIAWEDYTPVPGSGTESEIWMRVRS